MNFFQQLAALNLEGDLQIVARKAGEKMIVSVLLNNPKCGETSARSIIPLLFNDTPATIDAAFFSDLGAPLQIVSQTLTNFEAHLKSVEEAKKNSALVKASATPKAAGAAPVLTPEQLKQQKFDAAIKEVDTLAIAKKYKDALAKLPKLKDFPEQGEAIRAKQQTLMGLLTGTTSLFEPTPPAPIQLRNLLQSAKDSQQNPASDNQEDWDNDDDRSDDNTEGFTEDND